MGWRVTQQRMRLDTLLWRSHLLCGTRARGRRRANERGRRGAGEGEGEQSGRRLAGSFGSDWDKRA